MCLKGIKSSVWPDLELGWILLRCWRNKPISTFSFCILGAEDVVMAFSRSETEDRRQWPWAHPHTHTRYPALHVIHNNTQLHKHNTDELRRRGASGRGIRGVKDAADAASPSAQTFFTSPRPHTRPHIITWKMHSSGSRWAEALAIRQSVKTLKLCKLLFLFHFIWQRYWGSVLSLPELTNRHTWLCRKRKNWNFLLVSHLKWSFWFCCYVHKNI